MYNCIDILEGFIYLIIIFNVTINNFQFIFYINNAAYITSRAVVKNSYFKTKCKAYEAVKVTLVVPLYPFKVVLVELYQTCPSTGFAGSPAIVCTVKPLIVEYVAISSPSPF